MGLRELSQRAEIQYVSAATAVRRFAEKTRTDQKIAALLKTTVEQLHNE